MFSTANYISASKYKHNIDQCVSVIHHLPKLGQDCKRLPLYPRSAISTVTHLKDFRDSMSNIFENVFKINIRIIPHAKVSMNVTS